MPFFKTKVNFFFHYAYNKKFGGYMGTMLILINLSRVHRRYSLGTRVHIETQLKTAQQAARIVLILQLHR